MHSLHCDVTVGPCGVGNGSETLSSIDWNLQVNFAWGEMALAENRRPMVMNRVPAYASTNYNDLETMDVAALQGNLGAHRYPMAWTGDIKKQLFETNVVLTPRLLL